jgi:hypothetical protein
LRLSEIRSGFFGFLAQVFDSWAEFLRLRVDARIEGTAAPKDPFVSSAPEHWLELTAGLSFTEWGSDDAETVVLAPPAGPPVERAETEPSQVPEPKLSEVGPSERSFSKNALAENAGFIRTENSNSERDPAGPASLTGKHPLSESAVFIEKPSAASEAAEFVARKTNKAETSVSFISFAGDTDKNEQTPKFVPTSASAKQTPARFFKTETSVDQTYAEGIAPVLERTGDRSGNFIGGPAPENNTVQNTADASPKRTALEIRNSFPAAKDKGASRAAALFPEPHLLPVPDGAVFANRERTAANFSESGRPADSPPPSHPQNPAEFPRCIVSAQPDRTGFKENVFFPIPARKESTGVLPPGEKDHTMKDAPRDGFIERPKWAELPVLDLGGAAAPPEADHLRLRNLALLESEQKGERWSV